MKKMKFRNEKHKIVRMSLQTTTKDIFETQVCRKTHKQSLIRPLSAYMFFCREMRNKVKEENKDMDSQEIISELGRLWRALSENKRKPYIEKSKEDNDRYQMELKMLDSESDMKIVQCFIGRRGHEMANADFLDFMEDGQSYVEEPSFCLSGSLAKLYEGSSCSACMEDFVEEDKVRILQCGHAFHLKCIHTWMSICEDSIPIYPVRCFGKILNLEGKKIMKIRDPRNVVCFRDMNHTPSPEFRIALEKWKPNYYYCEDCDNCDEKPSGCFRGKIASLYGGTSCPGCMENFVEDESVRVLPCGHAFHRKCIDAWLELSEDLLPIKELLN